MINELSAVDDDIVLILDDLHVIESQPVHGAIAYLLDHLPPRMHLVVASRSDPPLPLTRLRARGDLIELRAADLRFTADEAAAFFGEVMGLRLSAGDVAALEARTEGWIAGLQLAALSIRGHEDVHDFIRSFAGDNRYVVDFLVEEVLQRQPECVRTFLLQTSILDRLSGPLCDAVTGQDDGTEMLVALERGNLFVVPLDDKRQWYRYHHLFADVLQARLREEQPDDAPVLHGRAGEWYEQNGQPADAVRHALAAGNFERAATMVERTLPAMRRSRQEAMLLGWLRALPDELLHARPVLSAVYAGALMQNGQLEGVEDRLRDAEQWLGTTACTQRTHEGANASSAEMVVVDEEEYRRLPASISVYRAGYALALGDVAGTARYARRALDLVAVDDHFWRGAAAALLGLASWTRGDLEAAHRSYADGMASLRKAGYIADAIGGVLALADIRIAQGRLHEAASTYQDAQRLATDQDAPGLRGTADMYVGMSELHREWNDLDAATRHLQTSKELGEHLGFPQNPYRSCVAMARIREAQGDLDGALDLIHEAERRYVSDFFPNVRPLAALRARVWVAQGRVLEALRWASAHDISVEDDLSYLREYEHLTLAKVLVARHATDRTGGSLREALALLERLRTAADAGERTGSVIEILVVQALALTSEGDITRALGSLERALMLAESEGYVRLFVGEGEPMQDLLRHAAAKGITPAYTRRLLTAFASPAQPTSPPTNSTSTPTQGAASLLVEPLTAREVEILRLIAAGLRNEQIADQLFISLATVKRHIANAYGKLDVGHRTEAIARANELNLL